MEICHCGRMLLGNGNLVVHYYFFLASPFDSHGNVALKKPIAIMYINCLDKTFSSSCCFDRLVSLICYANNDISGGE